MGIQVTRTETQPLPAGLYAATIEGITQEEGKFGPQLKTKFLIEEEGFEGKTLTGWASLTFSPKSKLFGWIKAAVFSGREIPETYKVFDSDQLIGRRVFLSVTTEKGSDGELYNKVKDLLPFRRSAAQPIPSAPPAPVAQSPAVTTRATDKPSAPPEPDMTERDWDNLQDPGPDFDGDEA